MRQPLWKLSLLFLRRKCPAFKRVTGNRGRALEAGRSLQACLFSSERHSASSSRWTCSGFMAIALRLLANFLGFERISPPKRLSRRTGRNQAGAWEIRGFMRRRVGSAGVSNWLFSTGSCSDGKILRNDFTTTSASLRQVLKS